MAFALAPNPKYDPLFAATVPLVQQYATQIWDGCINPGLLVRAHKAWFERRSSKPTWHGVHGPLGAVIMSLKRVGWSLEKGVALRSDTDELVHLLHTPRRVAALVESGITRWQLRDAARSLAFEPDEAPNIWLRHMRHMLSPKGLGQPAQINFFSLVTGGLKCPSRMTELDLSDDPSCSFCGYAQGTFAQWYACPGMYPIACREHAPILSQAREAWDSDAADTSLFWSLGIPSVPQPSVFAPRVQEATDLGDGG